MGLQAKCCKVVGDVFLYKDSTHTNILYAQLAQSIDECPPDIYVET